MKRYQRQTMLPEWGVATQEKLKSTQVLIAGAGGLGCPAALNLALAGVGHIKICDSDTVEMSNLNRQFLHTEERVGTSKVDSAKEALLSINSAIVVEAISQKITDENVDDIIGDAQVVVDCLDNFSARYALNACAVRKGVPMVHGAIWGLEGRVVFLHPPKTPCLACIFPKAPAAGTFPAVGAVSCVTGTLQALETIKYLASLGRLLEGRMLIIDGATMAFQELEVVSNPACPVCGALHQRPES
ncbi:MAG: HesA/MoeB/ThiF family protein [Thermodesulfobacteriota bacterium]|nr:HesA/MoeB/ThiF family protein [Thermodesulfobacteriota bacterium]